MSTTLPPAPLPSLAQKLLGIVEELTKVMEAETPLIREREYDRQAPLVKRKQELSLDYQAALKTLAENPSLLSGMSVEQKALLKSSGRKLDEVSRENAEAIRLAHIATERLLSVIMNEIRRDMHAEGGYSQRGMLAAAESAKARPMAYNQRV